MTIIGNHKKVCGQDGAFKCLDCKVMWGALGDQYPDLPPDECDIKPADPMPESFRQRSDRVQADISRVLERLKTEDPEKYQELVDAERRMYESYLEHRRQ